MHFSIDKEMSQIRETLCFKSMHEIAGGAVAQSEERATSGEEVPGSIPAVAGVIIM